MRTVFFLLIAFSMFQDSLGLECFVCENENDCNMDVLKSQICVDIEDGEELQEDPDDDEWFLSSTFPLTTSESSSTSKSKETIDEDNEVSDDEDDWPQSGERPISSLPTSTITETSTTNTSLSSIYSPNNTSSASQLNETETTKSAISTRLTSSLIKRSTTSPQTTTNSVSQLREGTLPTSILQPFEETTIHEESTTIQGDTTFSTDLVIGTGKMSRKRSLQYYRESKDWKCFIKLNENGEIEEKGCKWMNSECLSTRKCQECRTDKCNGSSSLMVSLFTFGLVYVFFGIVQLI